MTDVNDSSTQPWHAEPTRPTDLALLAPGTMLAERFRVVRLLGHGGQARVYEVFDTVLEQPCALKLLVTNEHLSTDAIEHLRNEVLLTRQINHPNVVRVHEFYVTENYVFFTMSLITGTPLTDVIDSSIHAKDVIHWFRQLLSALQACHETGIIHGDIKPANCIVNDQGDLIVVDFGIGRQDHQSPTTHFSAGYTAPELAQSHRATHASDRYALGKVLAALLQAGEQKSWASVELKHSRLRKLAENLQADEPEQRPSLASCTSALAPQQRHHALTLSVIAIMILVFAMLWFFQPAQNESNASSEKQVFTLAIASDDPTIAIAQLTHLMLQTEPQIYSVEPNAVAELTKQLGIRVLDSARERTRLAELTDAQYVLVLNQQIIAEQPHLLALLLRFPGEEVLLNETFLLSQETPRQLAQQVATQVSAQLGAGQSSAELTLNDKVADYLEQLQNAQNVGDTERAQGILKTMIETPEVGDFWRQQARAQLAMSEQNYTLAAQVLDGVIANYPDRADVLEQRAQVATALGDLQAARTFYRQALALDPMQPMWWFELAKLKIIQGEMKEAISQELTQALLGFRQQENQQGQGLVLNAFGVAYLRLAEVEQARDYFEMALPFRTADNQPVERITTLSNIATTAAILGDYAAAEEALREARDLGLQTGDELAVAHIENERGLLFEEQGLYQQALKHYKRALDLRLRSGDDYARSQSINNVAFINFLLGEFSLAEVYWRQALDIARAIDETATLHSIQISLAHLLILQGQFKQAEHLLAELISTTDKSPDAQSNTQLQVSRLNFALGRMQAAAEAADASVKIAEQLSDQRGLTESLLWQAEIALHLNQTGLSSEILATLRQHQEHFNHEQQLAFDWLQLMNGELQMSPQQFAERVLQTNLSRLLEMKILSELIYNFEFSKNQATWARLETILNETMYDAYFITLAARGDTESHQILLNKIRSFPSYWRNFELLQVLSNPSTETLAQEALEQLLENMNDSQRKAYTEQFNLQ
ncbi:protein kinase domain-containing protein [Pseudidiomarina homiensis]|uniref:Protein kinase domain-containing protein n=1 Tax=Pseudidiomarina homiensis TaxID=364198 RepID=A0A432Y7F6_9GAMM|nr:tetratricopeptide repeat protein [Pseudidiomarina homiensis]RUO56862.1 hypothetical protein CWI70_09055 [Pseudidiomarina homiensis]